MKLYQHITSELGEWIVQQQVFFVASAPLSGKHINVSPKGLASSSFSVLNENLCAYVDGTGSGIDNIANILENGRVTVMCCSFAVSPRILKLFCTGRVLEYDEPGFSEWLMRMGEKNIAAARAIVFLDVWKVQTSCGFAVPYLALKDDPNDPQKQVPYLEDRQTLTRWASKMVESDQMISYRAENNSRSLDGLPGLKAARRDSGEKIWFDCLRTHVRKSGGAFHTIFVAVISIVATVISMHFLGLTQPMPLTQLIGSING